MSVSFSPLPVTVQTMVAPSLILGSGQASQRSPQAAAHLSRPAMEAALAVLESEGDQTSLLDVMQNREELYDLLDYHDFDQRDRSCFGGNG